MNDPPQHFSFFASFPFLLAYLNALHFSEIIFLYTKYASWYGSASEFVKTAAENRDSLCGGKILPGVGNTSCSFLPGLHLPLGEVSGGDAPAQRLRPVFLVQLKLEKTRDKHVHPLFLILTNEPEEGCAL
jgi:hypothetical protein